MFAPPVRLLVLRGLHGFCNCAEVIERQRIIILVLGLSLQVVILIFFEKNITNLLSALFGASMPSLNVSELSENSKVIIKQW